MPVPQIKDSPLLTTVEAAERLRLNVWTVYKWLKAGKMPGVKLNGVWRVDAEQLQRWSRETPEKKD